MSGYIRGFSLLNALPSRNPDGPKVGELTGGDLLCAIKGFAEQRDPSQFGPRCGNPVSASNHSVGTRREGFWSSVTPTLPR